MDRVQTPAEIETFRRMVLTLAAYAYELRSETIMSDADFDAGCRLVDLSVDTNRPHLDEWFRSNFDPSTGMWIHRHPELRRVAGLYDAGWKGRTVTLGADGVFNGYKALRR